jgi:hypothetical protein
MGCIQWLPEIVNQCFLQLVTLAKGSQMVLQIVSKWFPSSFTSNGNDLEKSTEAATSTITAQSNGSAPCATKKGWIHASHFQRETFCS